MRLKKWTADDDEELPRGGFGYRSGMSSRELQDSARAWWTFDRSRVEQLKYIAAVHERVIRGVWEIDHATWRRASEATCRRLGLSHVRWGFQIGRASPIVEAAFLGRELSDERPRGRAVLRGQLPFAYWPS